MVKVKLKISRCGDRFSQRPGDIIEVGKDEALRMVESQQCELVNPVTVETAINKPSEKAIETKSSKKKSKKEK